MTEEVTTAQLQIPARDTVSSWLEHQHREFYICDSCRGLHLPAVREIVGVLDSKIDVEEQQLIFNATAELRPSALLSFMSEQAQLNLDFPAMKIFVDTREDALPLLVMSQALLTSAGINEAQFAAFLAQTTEQIGDILSYCKHKEWLYIADQEEAIKPVPFLH